MRLDGSELAVVGARRPLAEIGPGDDGDGLDAEPAALAESLPPRAAGCVPALGHPRPTGGGAGGAGRAALACGHERALLINAAGERGALGVLGVLGVRRTQCAVHLPPVLGDLPSRQTADCVIASINQEG